MKILMDYVDKSHAYLRREIIDGVDNQADEYS